MSSLESPRGEDLLFWVISRNLGGLGCNSQRGLRERPSGEWKGLSACGVRRVEKGAPLLMIDALTNTATSSTTGILGGPR